MSIQSIHKKNVLLASSKMSLHMIKVKRPYTKLEFVVLLCLKIGADLIHNSTKVVDKIKQIPLSDATVEIPCVCIQFKTTTNAEIIESPLFRHTVGRE